MRGKCPECAKVSKRVENDIFGRKEISVTHVWTVPHLMVCEIVVGTKNTVKELSGHVWNEAGQDRNCHVTKMGKNGQKVPKRGCFLGTFGDLERGLPVLRQGQQVCTNQQSQKAMPRALLKIKCKCARN